MTVIATMCLPFRTISASMSGHSLYGEKKKKEKVSKVYIAWDHELPSRIAMLD